MLLQLLALLNLISTKELTQFLVFGKDETGHFCDFSLTPAEAVSEVTIFEVIDDKNDQAVARVRLTPVGSPQSNGYSRIEIPEDLAVEGTTYSFQYTFEEGGHAFSENWTYDADRKQFALSSAVKKKFWKDLRFQIAMGITGVLGLIGLSTALYRKRRKSMSILQ
ncbi:uncharacterized protein VICG_01251 [Vittaforma corneae ATCC 50505]|uniref:GOLD domain-containing protein n=1 Tax=Vittaforma corneae (strain ATCC 50505) TaxID=993615 RepID=L2GN64_VITCO|nr:uncharacterized protein VICG_01251 [Vittaforma corneae ATCC 50505]ELA41747.1 hypothetical protein VICG_01251 [Vittaforma corneae ATCC 50505]